MKLLPPSDAPKRVRVSAYVLWVVLVAGIIVRFVFFDSQEASLAKLLWLTVIGAAIHAYFIVGISHGRNSARWVYPLLLMFGALAAPPALTDPFDVVPLVAQVFALIAVFTGNASAWFKKARVAA